MQEIIHEKNDHYASRGNNTEGVGLLIDLTKRVGGGYYKIFGDWWSHFDISGKGLLVGHGGHIGEAAKRFILKEYEKVTEVFTTDIERDADFMWDITSTEAVPASGFGFVACQAVLEHVVDPVQAMKNMRDVLTVGGMIFIHTHGPKFGHHRVPIDCYRYHRDVFIAWADLLEMELLDLWWNPHHCFAAYRKK